MKDNFSQILQRLLSRDTYLSSGLLGGLSPFKVQVSFDIPISQAQIDVDSLDKWLNLVKENFLVHNFFDRENITFPLLKVVLHVKDWWGNYCEKRATNESTIFTITLTLYSFMDVIKEQ
jgi:hypothetical protein